MSNMTDTIFVRRLADIDPANSALYGGKATGLARMTAAGISVPPGFVISTDGYRAFRAQGQLPETLRAQAISAITELERATGCRFGTPSQHERPLLVSVRSGAQVSMPGMMDTVLNLGITIEGIERLARGSGNTEFAIDTWLRFWRMFCDIVLDIDGDQVAKALKEPIAQARKVLNEETCAALESAVLVAIRNEGVEDIQTSPHWQLQRAIASVFQSWDSRRARAYRAHHGIDDTMGTAVTVQTMVFGNLDSQSGSGVAFTRNPNTGAQELYGEFLVGRQGEDLVSGSASPLPITEPGAMSERHLSELASHGQQLEKIYRDAVDIEFTVEGSKLYFLQVRPAKRTAQAAVVIATELAETGILSPSEALKKVTVEQLKRLMRPSFDADTLARTPILTEGIPASPGHALGIAVLDADRAAERAARGDKVIFVRPTTSPQDIRGMLASQAIVTARGGALSHAAVVSRSLDVPCVVGCEALQIDMEARHFYINGQLFEEGALLSVDGATGRIFGGHIPIRASAESSEHIGRLLSWADSTSGARFWTRDIGPADIDVASNHSTAGLGVIALTDLMIDGGAVNSFIAAINDLSQNPEDASLHQRISGLTKDTCESLLRKVRQTPVTLRLPNLGSPRAQKLIDEWDYLEPRLFLPLGLEGFYVSMLRGIADALRAADHANLTVLASGLSSEGELTAFRSAAESTGLKSPGVMLQSACGLFAAEKMAQPNTWLWLDLRELTRTFHGYPSALSFSDKVVAEQLADGHDGFNSRAQLWPDLCEPIKRLALCTAKGAQVGVDCGEGTALSLIEELYLLGLRHFSMPIGALAEARLALGQLEAKETTT
jgi:pyruvate,orthophosphate dikinase